MEAINDNPTNEEYEELSSTSPSNDLSDEDDLLIPQTLKKLKTSINEIEKCKENLNEFLDQEFSSLNSVNSLLKKIEKLKAININLNGKSINEEGLKLLTKFKFSNNIVELKLSKNNLDDNSLKHFSGSKLLSNLQKLDLSSNFITSIGIKYMLPLEENDEFSDLNELILKSNKIDVQGIVYLSNNTYLSNLTKLDLSDNNIDDDCLEVLKQNYANMKNLKCLNLNRNYITYVGVDYLCSSQLLPHITKLNLSSNKKIGNEGVRKLTRSLGSRNLEYLNLKNCQIDNDGVKYILKTKNFGKLKYLDLGENKLRSNIYEEFADCDNLENLRYISFKFNNIINKALKSFRKIYEKMEYINLSHNKISNEGVGYILQDLNELPEELIRSVKINLKYNVDITFKKIEMLELYEQIIV